MGDDDPSNWSGGNDPTDVDPSPPGGSTGSHEDEFDDENGEQLPRGNPDDHHHTTFINVLGRTGDSTPVDSETFTEDFHCEEDPTVDGEYGATFQKYALQIGLTGGTSGYLSPTTTWLIQGIDLASGDPRDGVGVVSDSVTVGVPVSVFDPATRKIVDVPLVQVTVDYDATPSTLTIRNHPNDGNYELEVTFAAVDDWHDPTTASQVVGTVALEGQEVVPSAELAAARAHCIEAKIRRELEGIQHENRRMPGRIPVPPEPDPLREAAIREEEAAIREERA